MKGCLLKEIGLKESLIAEITDKLHDLRVENSELSEKVSYLFNFIGTIL